MASITSSSSSISKDMNSSTHSSNEPAPYLDGRWGWVIASSGMFVTSMYAAAQRCFSVFYAVLMAEFGVTYGQVSWLNGVFLIGYGSGSIFIPYIYRRVSYRTGVMWAGLLSCAAVFAASHLDNFAAIVILMGLVPGLCTAANTVGMFSTVNRYFRRRRNTAMQVLCSGVSLGAFAYCPLFQVLIDALAWKGALQVIAGLYLNVSVVGALLRPLPKHKEANDELVPTEMDNKVNSSKMPDKLDQMSSDSSNSDVEVAGPTTRQKMAALCKQADVDILFDIRFEAYSWAWVFFSAAYYSSLTYLVPFGKTEMRFSDVDSAMLISAVSFGEIGSRALFGIFFDKFNKSRRMAIVMLINVFLACLFFLLTFVTNYWALLAICALLGSAGGGLDAVYAVFIVDIFGLGLFDIVCGYSSVIAFLMGSLTTVLMGLAIDSIGYITIVFYIGIGSLLVSSVLMFIVLYFVRKSS